MDRRGGDDPVLIAGLSDAKGWAAPELTVIA
jgi:hypothetical protein